MSVDIVRAVLAALLFASPASAQTDDRETSTATETAPVRRTMPTVGLETGTYTEELRVHTDDGRASVDAWDQWSARLSLGLAHEFDLPELETGVIRSETTLGVGLVIDRGTWPLYVRQAFSWELVDRSTALALSLGIGTGVQVNFHEPHFSYWEAGLVVGGRWGPLELFWYPHLVVPFAADEREVYGALATRQVQPSITPLHFMLRFRFDMLAF